MEFSHLSHRAVQIALTLTKNESLQSASLRHLQIYDLFRDRYSTHVGDCHALSSSPFV